MNISPFKIAIPKAELEDLQEKTKGTRWPNEIKNSGWERGVPLAYAKKLADYWLHTFDWKKQEATMWFSLDDFDSKCHCKKHQPPSSQTDGHLF